MGFHHRYLGTDGLLAVVDRMAMPGTGIRGIRAVAVLGMEARMVDKEGEVKASVLRWTVA